LGWTGNGNGYISEGKGVPDHSTGFWIPDQDLIFENGHYSYLIKLGGIKLKRSLKYVGFENPIAVIPSGTKVRVSLAKWWHPEDIVIEDRCYLQLSGWY
jgi:hypothetical protein